MTTTVGVLLAFLAWVGGAYAADTGRIYGIVLDDETGKPIPGVEVRADWSSRSSWTQAGDHEQVR